MRYGKMKNKGQTIILVAGITLGFLLIFAVLAIDFSRMYYVRGELQSAADSAALAGADKLNDPSNTDQPDARAEAVKFAAKNLAANSPVVIENDGSNTPLDSNPDNDITVGNWNINTRVYTLGGTPVNAVQVRARRNADVSSGPVPFLFPKLIPGLANMGVARVAIAARLPKAQAPIALCTDSCTSGVIAPTGTLLYFAPYPSEVIPGNVGIAWTSFNAASQSSDKDAIYAILCGSTKDACGLTVYTNNGNDNELARQFRCAFKNPLYFSSDKTCSDGNCDSATDNVTSWEVLVPIFTSPNGCPPGDQPLPDTVVQYGRLRIREVYASGGGGTNKCACGAYDAPSMSGSTPNAILVDQIVCQACATSDFLGKSSQLVR